MESEEATLRGGRTERHDKHNTSFSTLFFWAGWGEGGGKDGVEGKRGRKEQLNERDGEDEGRLKRWWDDAEGKARVAEGD